MLRNTIVKTLIAYPCILLVSYFWVTIVEVWSLSYPHTQNFELVCFAEFLRAINGFLNALVYGFSDAVRWHLGWGPKEEDLEEDYWMESDYFIRSSNPSGDPYS